MFGHKFYATVLYYSRIIFSFVGSYIWLGYPAAGLPIVDTVQMNLNCGLRIVNCGLGVAGLSLNVYTYTLGK